MLKQQQERLRQDYERKLADIEKERESIEEEKAQVDRYKQLLLKQRDIMIALTQRLVERDEQIMALQVRTGCTVVYCSCLVWAALTYCSVLLLCSRTSSTSTTCSAGSWRRSWTRRRRC